MTFPITEYSDLSIAQRTDVRLSDRARYKRHRAMGSEEPFWVITVTNTNVPYSEGMAMGAQLNSYLGAFNVFALPNPFPEIVTRSGLAISQIASKGDTVILMKNAPLSNPVALAAGDFFNISGHSKTYQVVSNAVSNGSGIASVKITPPLSEDIALNAAVNYGQDAVFQVCLAEEIETSVSAGRGRFMVFDFELMEQG